MPDYGDAAVVTDGDRLLGEARARVFRVGCLIEKLAPIANAPNCPTRRSRERRVRRRSPLRSRFLIGFTMSFPRNWEFSDYAMAQFSFLFLRHVFPIQSRHYMILSTRLCLSCLDSRSARALPSTPMTSFV
jgi:hypothetical protein